MSTNNIESSNIARFLLLFFLGFIGSFIINHTSLKPLGWKCRTWANLFLGILTLGIYCFVVAICSIFFKSDADKNIGYFKDTK